MNSLRRAGLIGDVHAQADWLEAAILFFQSAAVDAILCTGDVVDGPGDAARCCNLLEQYGVLTVRGNHDRWFLRDSMRDLPDATPVDDLPPRARMFLIALPATREFSTVAGPLLLCHGLGENDMAQLRPDDYGYALEANDDLGSLLSSRFDWVVGGHTHHRMVRGFEKTGTRHSRELTIINPGTLFPSHEPCFAIADWEQGSVQFYDFAPDGAIAPGE